MIKKFFRVEDGACCHVSGGDIRFIGLHDNAYRQLDDAMEVSPPDSIVSQEEMSLISHKKLDAFEYKGVSCSVKEADQNGWTVVDKRIKELLAIGTEWRTIYFQMENGNVIPLETQTEWEEFYNLCWDNRERLMNEKAQILMNM